MLQDPSEASCASYDIDRFPLWLWQRTFLVPLLPNLSGYGSVIWHRNPGLSWILGTVGFHIVLVRVPMAAKRHPGNSYKGGHLTGTGRQV